LGKDNSHRAADPQDAVAGQEPVPGAVIDSRVRKRGSV
jgi:hypothetical protein